jgi:hypothetical protein
MKFQLYQDVVLAVDLPECRLKRGDIVKLVEHHVAPGGQEGYSAEVLNALGDTLAVIAVPEAAVKPLREDEVLCARALAAA